MFTPADHPEARHLADSQFEVVVAGKNGMAFLGQDMQASIRNSGVPIKLHCHSGTCGTCASKSDGASIPLCLTRVPSSKPFARNFGISLMPSRRGALQMAGASRRGALQMAGLSAAGLVGGPPLAYAASASAGKAKLKQGYDGIEYLLTNWDKETFKQCGVAGQVALKDECDRDANKVPGVLGMRSTEAPLFKIERTFKEILQSGDADVDIDKWNEAVDQFVQHSTSAQEYAYTASFGEYNPSGGKDQVSKYMDLSRDELKLAQNALKDVLQQLAVL